ncbi:MAG: AAA family ATPase [Bacteroidales bacterium]|nr:AAA family ATPase [Bacteroidales bacterium]
MILKNILIKNFRSYYGENRFEFSKGLTLIIGDNGDGKTTFFEALEWLFDTAHDNIPTNNVSEKRKSELTEGDEDEVKVSLVFDHNGEIELEKSFKFFKNENGDIRPHDLKFVGYQNIDSERIVRKGKQLLDECFDTALRRYCLFKGESDLNVFDNSEALKTLVNTFSNIRQFEDYVKLTEQFDADSEKIALRELSKDKKQERAIKDLESRKIQNSTQIQDVKQEIAKKEKAVSDYSISLEKLEQNQETCEQYQNIKKRIEMKMDDQRKLKAMTSIDYNTNLLDKYWIMRSYPAILKEFQDKVSALNKEKRRLDRAETERRAEEKGKRELANDLLNGKTPLPWYVPDEKTMQEMINEEVCKVCGRPAPKGSEPYNFMVAKLNDYLRQMSAKKEDSEDEKPFFPNNYIDELTKLSNQLSGYSQQEIEGKKSEIDDDLAFVLSRKRDLDKINHDIQEAEDEKARLLIQTQGISEDMLDKGFKDFKGITELRSREEGRLIELKRDLIVLFAISNITTLKREQDYPLIFDAPTSSFGELKEYVFYNIIDRIDKQCIIVTKDLLEVDQASGTKRLNAEKLSRLECTVYQINKASGYNPLDLSTIQTIVKPIK